MKWFGEPQKTNMPRPPLTAGQENREGTMDPQTAGMILRRKESEAAIGTEEVQKAAGILRKYAAAKESLKARLLEDEKWWELRHWEAMRGKKKPNERGVEPTSGWLFNAILNKHADAMDNYPEPVVLPREKSDEESARILSEVLPVVIEQNEFEKTYSDNWWEKLKHGTAGYGVFWDREKENGLGDITIQAIDLLKLYWEPGITDIQQSRNLFLVELVDTDLLEQQYPRLAGKLGGTGGLDVASYTYDEQVDTGDKSVVVDWYYKVKAPNGRTLLHYVKFVGDEILYASENDPQYRHRGYYDHGLYPVVLDIMFPEKGTPVGFGYVAICKDPQLYIDKLFGNILENSIMGTKKRFMVSESTNINEQELLDWNKPLIHVQGELSDTRVKEITVTPPDDIYVSVVQMKIEEMKDTAANRDVNSGGAGSGVTAAAAIAALQEAGNKASRDMIATSYRTHVKINALCVELMRQFYDVARSFRVAAPNQQGYDFVDLSNAALKDQPTGRDSMGEALYRKPIFDLKVKAQKKNPFSRAEQNERAKELYGLGFFNPDRAQESLGALEMMDFEGIDGVREYVRQGQTLLQACQALQQQNAMLTAAMGLSAGTPAAERAGGSTSAAHDEMVAAGGKTGENGQVLKAQTPMTGYGEALAKRSSPNMDAGGEML